VDVRAAVCQATGSGEQWINLNQLFDNWDTFGRRNSHWNVGVVWHYQRDAEQLCYDKRAKYLPRRKDTVLAEYEEGRGYSTVVSKCSGNDHYPRGRGVNNVRLESSNFSDDSRTEG
jgi:hypothetical protein